MDPETKLLQRKIIGVLVRAAREKTRRTVKEVAQRMGVTSARVRQWERGARELTLPQLEILAHYFHTPLAFFVQGDSMPSDSIPPPPSEEYLDARHRAIGAKLKQARHAADKKKEECATHIARKPGTIGRYERGVSEIPLTELTALAQFLNVTLDYFVEPAADRSDESDLRDLEKIA
ncbi:MAG: helix-turn-helix transcriptional regulator [Chloroflexi bacterium]|nr:helix-turn-helix transcriptional regulator [Chloroflexota bacterium]